MAGDHSEERREGSTARWPLGPGDLTAGGHGDGATGERSGGLGLQRAEFGLAALREAGEVGYGRLTVEGIVAAARSNRSRFYGAFEGKEACYAAGYGATIEVLVGAMLARAAEASDWSGGLRGALEELSGFLATDEVLARGVLVEVRVAGGPAAAKRTEVFERLSRAIDRARRETRSRHSPPPVASDFILNGLEAIVIMYLRRGRGAEFAGEIDDLTELAATFYPGVRDGRRRR